MKALLKTRWFWYTIETVVICLVCIFFAGPKGLLYGLGFVAFYFVTRLVVILFGGRMD
jgi:hypothetical protein